MKKQHAWVIQSGVFFSPGWGYSEADTHNYTIQRGFTGLRMGVVRKGEGWLFFKGKVWINRINKVGFLCLSSVLPHRPDQSGAESVSNCTREQQIVSFSVCSVCACELAVTESLLRNIMENKTTISVIFTLRAHLSSQHLTSDQILTYLGTSSAQYLLWFITLTTLIIAAYQYHFIQIKV